MADITIDVNVKGAKKVMTEEQKKAREERLQMRRQKREQKKREKAARKQAQARVAAADAAGSPGGFVTGKISQLTSLIPHAALITAIAGAAQEVIRQLFAPGGIFDRRLRIEVNRQFNAFQSRQRARELATGKRLLHVQAHPGIAGIEGTVGGNAYALDRGDTPRIDLPTQYATKGFN